MEGGARGARGAVILVVRRSVTLVIREVPADYCLAMLCQLWRCDWQLSGL